ncbi:MAG TPA: Fe-S biogenesis protein NfuA [Agitococcus sp.]|nr:Fe-S biogenesis protein NfuA [Agitococcus sp.]HNA20466.1 Fe-S biogenesis protein NfuA [Agitococcus sp.]HNC02423.1 Fe-S biogenesis protein NfuA [Agitococcus sp.]HNG46728.1 Fe-S biogenesis protein NfuA [Agitococcus sp.]HNI62828.1 Fe-S biogenesis protein NfuA [Agitococcus sp.]
MSNLNINITESAQAYLRELLAKQNSEGIGVRIFVENAGTPKAECCMAYCTQGEEQIDDIRLPMEGFPAYIEFKSSPYLEDAVIDYNKDRFGGQLTFKAPKSKVPLLGENSSLEERINHVLFSEINPSLAAHNGNVSLLDVYEDTEHGLTAVLKFGGGCQGCSAVDMTLKQGVETTLKANIPELQRVTDSTDHSQRDNAYFK